MLALLDQFLQSVALFGAVEETMCEGCYDPFRRFLDVIVASVETR
jgi:hypothetical protein